MKKTIPIVAILLALSISLSAKSIYIQVMSVYQQSNLFNVSYKLNELGYSMSVTEKDALYKVYSGPFEDRWSANRALKEIKKKIASDAYIVELSIEKNKIKVEKESQIVQKLKVVVSAPQKVVKKPETAQVIVIENGKVSEVKVQQQSSSQISSNNFFVGLSLGATKFDLDRVNISLSSVAYNYAFEVGYYFTPNIYMTLNYYYSALQGAHLDTFATSVNYKLNPIFFVSPYVGLIGGLNTLTWEHSSYVDNVESAFVPGVQLGFELPMSDNATIVLFGKYMLLDYKSVASSSASNRVEFNSELSGNVGFRYNF